MSTVLFTLGFLGTGFAGVEVLSKHDPEPAGAFASLFMLLVLATLLTVTSHRAVSYWTQRSPRKIACFISGIISAVTFFSLLGLIHAGFGFRISLSIAFLGVVVVAGVLSTLSPRIQTK